MNKKCPDCNETKELKFFYNSKNRPDKVASICKKCSSYRYKEYRKTLTGLISIIYNHQKQRSKEKGYDLPKYSKKQLKEWIIRQSNFELLFNQWKYSNYNKDYSPSVDRLDDYKPYTLDNIKLMTWKENREKYYKNAKEGLNNKNNLPIQQINKVTGDVVETYYSISEASRKTNISRSGINKVCMGKLNTSGGFKWKYDL